MSSAEPGGLETAWSAIAAGYDEHVTPTHQWLGNEGLRRASVGQGMRFLDVAAGSGALSLPAARLGARVVSTDISPVMLARLAARAKGEGLDLECRVMDGQALDLPDGEFDAAGSQFGVMLFPDMPRGIAEMARVVRPGGKVLMTVYGPPDQVEFIGFFIHAIQSVRPEFTGPPMDPPPLPFQLQDPGRLRGEMEKAGLEEVHVETITERLEFRSGKGLWDWLLNSNPIPGAILEELKIDPGERSKVRKALEGLVAERAGGSPTATLTNPIHIGVGTRRG